jgi:tetratricopeptide (TPR) repeat protein
MSRFPLHPVWRSVLISAIALAGQARHVAAADAVPAESAPAAPATSDEPAAPDKPAVPDAPAGQDELDAAIDVKIGARSLNDYDRVLKHCRRAIELGLDDDSKRFAEDLYTGTLVDRAGLLVDVIYGSTPPDPQWPRMRALALSDLAEILTRDPDLGQAHLMVARLESLPRGDRERARAAATRAIELLADDRLQQARAHLVLGSLEDDPALRGGHYDDAVELAPRDADIRRTRGLFRLVNGKHGEACDDLAAAIDEQPDDASLREAFGMACLMSDRLDDAAEAFDRAIELAPDAAGPYVQRGRLKAVQGDLEAALVDIDRAIEIDPSDASAYVLRARIHQQAGDEAEAIEDVESVLGDDPGNVEALELRGLIHADQGDYAAAIRDFRRLASKNPEDAAIASQLGMLYLMARQPREAIRRFTRALEIDEEHFPSRRGRSDARISIGDHAAALTDLERALEQRPDDSGVLNNLAWLLATSPDDAIRDGARAIELAKKACEETEWEESHIISTLAAAYAEAGDFDSARKYSRQAVETSDPDAGVREQLEEELTTYEKNEPYRELQAMEEEPLEGDAAEPEAAPAAAKPADEIKPRRPFQLD